ncbi:2-dehydro-3-deoxygalactonokinase [Celeribacter litoreus]|uniref:2-dehydro-3-deoxygalactonokinase n=1 Tax=Celeribacter litoreus TaxID=2876714 RepID=UPI001CCD1334|nr:2-dehydro-3-deoxygalactonokinase [Celeribacter litoreus]MCA0042213.1 2-dehydro-3-deoxygalactonokinase [Celeribacter litoreus]
MSDPNKDKTPQPRALPCTPLPDQVRVDGGQLILPSLSQKHPPTQTTGEEFQLAGLVATQPKFDGILVLPSDESTLWAHVSAEEIVSMRRFATGRILSAFFTTGLHHGDADAFKDALSDAMSKPETIALTLSALDTQQSNGNLTPEEAASRATAALIGAELAASRAYWLGQPVMLIGTPALCAPYIAALEAQFVPVLSADKDKLFQAGVDAALAKATA